MFRCRLRTLFIVLALGPPALAVGFVAIRQWNRWNLASWQVSGMFSEAPSDDVALEAWLSQQPGVRHASVFRAEGAIFVYWDVYYPVFGAQPPPLDIAPALTRFGYTPKGPLDLRGWHEP